METQMPMSADLQEADLQENTAPQNQAVPPAMPLTIADSAADSAMPPEGLSSGGNDLPQRLIPAAKPETPSATIPAGAIAQQVTVRVITHPIAGSGVLLKRRANTYLVLTCDHVVAESRGSYRILTSDGKTHAASRLAVPALEGLDLALLKFQSDIPYPTVALGDSNALTAGTPVYASGFPNYRFYREQDLLASTASWGVRAYQFTEGQYRMSIDSPLPGGYQLGYTNNVEQGMSGGPVLDAQGRLVGINGRLKYPIQGIDAYTFADGTQPPQALFQQMEALSWAIPISRFRQPIEAVLAQPQF
jgi:hypothetical protein